MTRQRGKNWSPRQWKAVDIVSQFLGAQPQYADKRGASPWRLAKGITPGRYFKWTQLGGCKKELLTDVCHLNILNDKLEEEGFGRAARHGTGYGTGPYVAICVYEDDDADPVTRKDTKTPRQAAAVDAISGFVQRRPIYADKSGKNRRYVWQLHCGEAQAAIIHMAASQWLRENSYTEVARLLYVDRLVVCIRPS